MGKSIKEISKMTGSLEPPLQEDVMNTWVFVSIAISIVLSLLMGNWLHKREEAHKKLMRDIEIKQRLRKLTGEHLWGGPFREHKDYLD